MWWSVDPGEVHVGLALWEQDQLMDAKEVTPREMIGLLADYQPPLVVIEGFSLRSPKWTNAQSRQAVATLKLIGGVETLCTLAGTVCVEQQPSVRHVAQASKFWRLLREQIPANGHARSAIAHGIYYLHFAKR